MAKKMAKKCKYYASDPLAWESEWCRKGYIVCMGKKCKHFKK